MVKKKRLHLFDSENVSTAKSVAVIGLGRFGQSIALELMSDGAEVLGIDSNPKIVQAFNDQLSHVVAADATNPEVLEQLDILDFDQIVVAIGTHLESSILTTSWLVRQGVENLWAKAVSDQHGVILQQLGVSRVIYPEKDMGRRVAHLLQGGLKEYIQIDSNNVIVMSTAPEVLVGQKLTPQQIYDRFNVSITSYKDGSGTWHRLPEVIDVDADSTILYSGPPAQVERFAKKYL